MFTEDELILIETMANHHIEYLVAFQRSVKERKSIFEKCDEEIIKTNQLLEKVRKL